MALDLLYLTVEQQKRRAEPKGVPHIVARQEKKKLQSQVEDDFRKGVRKRDGMKSRATGKPLVLDTTNPDKLADVHHVLKRSTNPEGKWEIERGILLSRTEHKYAETRCLNAPEHYMLDISGPDDLGEKQTFTWRDIQGVITKTRNG